MERRQHNRIPVELNAVLIGEKTVPKGCKVSNISEQGLLLTCVADGRVSTFEKGNTVNVHLLFQQSGSCKYLTKKGNVRHAGENSIGMQFDQPDSKLVEFLKPCRTDSDQDQDQGQGQDQGTASAGVSAPVHEGIDMQKAINAEFISEAPGTTTVAPTSEPAISKAKERKASHAGMAFLLLGVALALGAYLLISNINKRISALETVTEKHTNELAEVQEWALPASMLEGKFAYLNAQMKALTDSFSKLENRLAAGTAYPPVKITALPDTPAGMPAAKTGSGESMASTGRADAVEAPVAVAEMATEDAILETMAAAPPAATAEKTRAEIIEETTTEAPPAAIAEKTPAEIIEETTTEAPPAAIDTKTSAETAPETIVPAAKAGAKDGRWVINLSSSPDRAAADWFMARARSKGIPVEMVQAQVKGRDYWRVQLTGFVSHDAAHAYAGPLKEKLGLKDVWIYRQ
jgi:cell division septation protein DedD